MESASEDSIESESVNDQANALRITSVTPTISEKSEARRISGPDSAALREIVSSDLSKMNFL
jgi:hypothetical protein